MPYLVGLILGIVIALFTKTVGLDRDRGVYPTIVIVVALYYVLFAVMGGSIRALGIETAVMLGFTLLAVVGFARSPWWIVAALAGHGVFDSVHGGLIANSGVPVWWPAFCMSIDVTLAACLAGLLLQKRPRSPSAGSEPELRP
jgi:hypothetical protein